VFTKLLLNDITITHFRY